MELKDRIRNVGSPEFDMALASVADGCWAREADLRAQGKYKEAQTWGDRAIALVRILNN